MRRLIRGLAYCLGRSECVSSNSAVEGEELKIEKDGETLINSCLPADASLPCQPNFLFDGTYYHDDSALACIGNVRASFKNTHMEQKALHFVGGEEPGDNIYTSRSSRTGGSLRASLASDIKASRLGVDAS